eukprot:scaffold384_cov238-Pinguiococcus_pyrenoidosus.AAC.3
MARSRQPSVSKGLKRDNGAEAVAGVLANYWVMEMPYNGDDLNSICTTKRCEEAEEDWMGVEESCR